MKKIYAFIFAFLFLAINYSCKNEKITKVEDSKSNIPKISAVKVNGELFIKKETNGKVELLKQLVTDELIATPVIDENGLLILKFSGIMSKKKNNNVTKNVTASYRVYGGMFTCDGVIDDCAWLVSGRQGGFHCDTNGDLLWGVNRYNITQMCPGNSYVLFSDMENYYIYYFDCIIENSPVPFIEEI